MTLHDAVQAAVRPRAALPLRLTLLAGGLLLIFALTPAFPFLTGFSCGHQTWVAVTAGVTVLGALMPGQRTGLRAALGLHLALVMVWAVAAADTPLSMPRLAWVSGDAVDHDGRFLLALLTVAGAWRSTVGRRFPARLPWLLAALLGMAALARPYYTREAYQVNLVSRESCAEPNVPLLVHHEVVLVCWDRGLVDGRYLGATPAILESQAVAGAIAQAIHEQADQGRLERGEIGGGTRRFRALTRGGLWAAQRVLDPVLVFSRPVALLAALLAMGIALVGWRPPRRLELSLTCSFLVLLLLPSAFNVLVLLLAALARLPELRGQAGTTVALTSAWALAAFIVEVGSRGMETSAPAGSGVNP